jgi:RNA recognition motif-containing protein
VFYYVHIICRTGDSRGFAFVRYKYADEAEKAIERLDGKKIC